MARTVNITGSDNWYVGTDHEFICEILNGDGTAAIDITGWSLSWMMKKRKADLDAAAVLTKATGGNGIVISGVFNAVTASNLQRATITVQDTDYALIRAGSLYYHELKRTDGGTETILIEGTATPKQGVHLA